MKKLIILFLCTVLSLLASCGQTDDTNSETEVTPVVAESPSDTEGTMTEDSSTIIIEDNSTVIEWKAQGGVDDNTDGPL